MKPFCLVQLSDCHLTADSEADYRGENADVNLGRVLAVCRALAPDGIVLSGDLAEDGSAAAYERLARLLLAGDETGTPLVVDPERIAWLPGNHDDRRVMARCLAPFSAGPLLDWGGWQLVLLDSTWPGRIEGELDEERLAPLAWLDATRPALVFLHHQPVPTGLAWIDGYSLVRAERLWQRLPPAVRVIAFGHVHHVFTGGRQRVACLSAPSTVANTQVDTPRFTLDASGPGARWFRLWPDGRWASGIVRGT